MEVRVQNDEEGDREGEEHTPASAAVARQVPCSCWRFVFVCPTQA